jgi:hypothetical protein
VERAVRATIFHPAFPNPFNPNTTLRFDLAKSGVVRLDIVDVRGRIVRSLVRCRQAAAGEHRVVWDGRDDRGQRLASGVYEARLLADGGIWTGRLTLLE